MKTALKRLDSNVAASDASSAPNTTSTHTTSRRRRHEETQGSSSGDLFALSQSIRFLANAEDDRQVRRRIADLQDQARNYRRMLAESDDPSSARARFYLEEVQQINEEI